MSDIDLILFVSTILFGLGIYGLSTKRDAIRLLMSVELMLNAANLNFIGFAHYLFNGSVDAQLFVLFIIALAAAEVGVGIAIFLSLYRVYKGPEIDLVSKIKEEE